MKVVHVGCMILIGAFRAFISAERGDTEQERKADRESRMIYLDDFTFIIRLWQT